MSPTITDGITIPVITTGTGPPMDEEFEDESEENSSKEYDHDKPSPAARKGHRIERGADARRYHTAGAIEDIKVKRDVLPVKTETYSKKTRTCFLDICINVYTIH